LRLLRYSGEETARTGQSTPPAKYPIFEAVRILSVEARELSSEGFDGLQAECAGLGVLVLSDVEALQARCDSIRDSIANVGILKALKIAGIRQVSGHDVDLRGLQPLQRRPGTSMRPAVGHTGARNHLALNEFGELLTGRRVHIGVVLKSEIERRASIGVFGLADIRSHSDHSGGT